MTPEHEQQIRERLAAATPGPWRTYCHWGDRDSWGSWDVDTDDGRSVAYIADDLPMDEQANAELIAHAPADIAALLDEVGRLREALGATHDIVELREGDWAIQHAVTCRPDMFSCVVHRRMESAPGPPKLVFGRYRILSTEGDGPLGMDWEPVA